MKYAKEVIELLAAYPGKEFRMAQIVRHVSRGVALSTRRRQAIRVGVKRVLYQLEEMGQIEQVKEGETSSYYKWKCVKLTHELNANCYVN